MSRIPAVNAKPNPLVLSSLVLGIASTASAQNYYGSPGNPYTSGGSSNGDGSSSSGFNNFNAGAGFDINAAMRTRAIHGILAALAMAILFPSGSILMRVIPGRFAIWAHGISQAVALVVYIAAVGLGLHLVREVGRARGNNGDMFSDPNRSYHPIIGIVVLVCLLLQPIFGFIHHAKFKRLKTRQMWSYLHLFNGRVFITLGMANGGLGLWMAGASKELKTAYVAVAAVMWVLWMLAAAYGEWKRWKANRLGYPPRNKKFHDGEVPF
ncbi:hypothetical protein QC761_403460 [Podospora bellae-mahoneyi]|uniref:Cytochrome b561 domain-containing protein n=1 Tax=Podospora bellae-mahoneyi TaxID=2093777 RepID=A0ABR0FIU7_9PEZI|nr:hypothetical protein QC761_403460 [Podospora bellae-mahoneyi]